MVLFKVSSDYPSVNGRLHTRYAPVRRSPSRSIATSYAAPRLACVRPAASVYPEPGSNSPLSNLSRSSSFLLELTSCLFFLVLRPYQFFRNSFLLFWFWLSHSFNELSRSKESLKILFLRAIPFNPISRRPLSLPSDLKAIDPFAGAKIIPFFTPFQIKSVKHPTFFC